MASMLFTTFGIFAPMAYNIFLILAVVGFFGVFIPWNERKKRAGGKKPAAKAGEWKRPPRPARPLKPAFRSEAPDHEHIIASGQGIKKRLEQLEVLKNAGLLTQEEYMKKRKETMKEQ